MKASAWLNWTVFAIILLAFCIQALFALPKLSATADEPDHIGAGYSYWQTRDFRMNPEHPPLAKLIATFPLLWIHPKMDTNHEYWKTVAEYPFGSKFLYENDADRLLFWSRTAMVGIAALGLLFTYLWARDLFGPAAGLFAAAMYAFSPNVLAHSMLVTTDVPLAAFTVLTFYLFWKRKDVYAGLALGVAMAVKFSGAFLPILIAILCFARDRRGAFKRLAIMGVCSVLIIEAAYLFSHSPLLYFKNGMLVNVKVVPNYPFYLFGQLKTGGWWYYFLVAFVVKATIPTLLLILAALADLRTGFIDRWGEIMLISCVVFILLITTIGANQIGFRYLVPVIPLLFVWTSRVVPRLATTRTGIGILATLLLWQAWSAVHAFPNYIPYFNELAGGADNGSTILDDSNIDWGQGVKQAADYVRAHRLQNVNIYTFSPFDNPPYYGLPPNIPLSEAFKRLVVDRPKPGIYIISAHYVTRMKVVSPAWQKYKPMDRIGNSLLVYAFE
jgi:4-amino-4-deoxy-L-arabinose transferase-like glycosyltransferase